MQRASSLPAHLPALRQELALHPGPAEVGGAPTWTLHDPTDNRFFQLSWPAFEILSRWALGTPTALLEALRRETTLDLDAEALSEVLGFLGQHHLLRGRSAEASAHLSRAASAQRMSKPMWLLKHYLFFRLPLLRPMPLLRAVSPYVQWIFTPGFWLAVLAVAVLGLYLVSQQWDSFMHTFAAYAGWQGVLGIGIALSLAKVLHELGHALTAHRYGCRVPTMGVAFLVLVPVLYTDTNEAWKLASRRPRLHIAMAGMAAEIALAAWATLVWSFLPDGPLRAGVFLLATSTWLITLAINLSPFMRFDGYFLLADWLDMPNLHDRAFALGRWRLREWLFGLGDPPPEQFAPARQRFLIVFAYATWMYRLVLFLGIALLVYHLFFKLLGIFLLLVELGWFIARPVRAELQAWWALRERLRWNGASRRSLCVLIGLLAVVLLPWPRGIGAPAVLGAERAQWLYAPAPARVQTDRVKVGQSAKAGQVLIELDSTDLRHQLQLAQAREQQLSWQVAQQSFDARLQDRGATLPQRLQAARAEVQGLQALAQQLTLAPDFDGQVVARNPALQAGAWVARGEPLLQIAQPRGVKVDAYVDERQLADLRVGEKASFIADDATLPRVDCRIEAIDRIALSTLEHAALASLYGGPIAVSQGEKGHLLPLEAHFRVRLTQCEGLAGTPREYVGQATLGRRTESLLMQAWRYVLAVGRREATL